MPSFKGVHATLPASDLERAKAFYADTLGLRPVDESEIGAYYEIGSSRLLVYPSSFAGTNAATAATLEVDDIEATVAELRGKGVTFEEYEFPGVTFEGGVATAEMGGRTMKSAWFKDTEGNILAVATS